MPTTKPATYSGEIVGFPSYDTMNTQLGKNQPVIFTLDTGAALEEVQVIKQHSSHLYGDTYEWWGIICPVEAIHTARYGVRSICVISRTDRTIYI